MTLLVIALFIAVFVGLSARDLLRMRGRPATTGTVVENIYDPHRGEIGGLYQSVIEFRTGDGRVVRSHDGTWSSRPAYPVGAEVAVRYDVRNPERSLLVGRKSTVLLVAVALFLIGLFVVIAVR